MLDLTVNNQLPVITTNFEEVKESLNVSIKKYKNLVVTEEGLKGAKADQVVLSKLETKIDDYRKSVKREVEKPIKDFEGKCKELIGLVSDARVPLKASIQVFDDAEKEKKKMIAKTYIDKTVIDLLLNDKYGSQLTVLETYSNVSMSIKKLKEDIEKRGYLLQKAQQQEAENLQIIKDTIVNVNKGIDAKLEIQDFQMLIDTNTSISQILATINGRAERIKSNEEKAIADKAAKAEKVVQDRINKAKAEEAERVRIEERNARIAKEKEEALIKETQRKQEISLQTKISNAPIEVIKEVEPPIKKVSSSTKKYFIEMRAENMTIEEVNALSKFLKDNNYSYAATKTGLM